MNADDKKDIKVSVVCAVYNHALYLQETLQGFVDQETNYDYEVFVHDDASVDNSAEIIKKYAERYPDIIKPIYQSENQYSKGVRISSTFIYPYCKGKYFALCEGDDYWIDKNKLQKQYDLLEEHPEVNMCAHGARIIDAASEQYIGEICPRNEFCILSVEEVIAGGGGFLSTNSLFFKREVVFDIPEYMSYYQIDYTMQINGALYNGILFSPDIMSVYRANVPGSWSMRTRNKIGQADNDKKIMNMLLMLDNYTHQRFHETIIKTYTAHEFNYYRQLNDEYLLLSPKYSKLRKKLRGTELFIFLVKAYLPKTIKITYKLLHKT